MLDLNSYLDLWYILSYFLFMMWCQVQLHSLSFKIKKCECSSFSFRIVLAVLCNFIQILESACWFLQRSQPRFVSGIVLNLLVSLAWGYCYLNNVKLLTHECGMFFHSLSFFFFFLWIMFCSFLNFALFKCISKYFILFDAVVTRTIFLISLLGESFFF